MFGCLKLPNIHSWNQHFQHVHKTLKLACNCRCCLPGRWWDSSPPSEILKWHICVQFSTRIWEAEAWVMSFGGLCSAWSVFPQRHLDSPLEEFNLHHTPRRATLLFLSKCFHRHHPVRNSPHHLSSRTDSSGESDGSTLSFQKAKYDFQFFMSVCHLYIVLRSGTVEGRRSVRITYPVESWFWPNLSTQTELSLLLVCQSLPITPVSGRCTIIIEHEMLLAS